jgi:eukaryotic-like serine/threonine-protein kinase
MSLETEHAASGHVVLGRYRVVQRLAKGGMGVVYLGRLEGAAGFAKPVVIKRIIQDSDDPTESTARFIREAQILSNLQHPGIVGVLDFGEEEAGHAMILEYVHGYDLGRWLKYLQLSAHQLHWEEAVFVMLRVLEALNYAHSFRRSDGTAAQVLHRDISPGNVLLDLEGRVRLLDFGIARMAESDVYRTQTGVLKGKVPFLAPELFTSDPPSAASDIYACGVVLYQMLAGSHPFTGENDSKLMWRIITEGPKPLSEWRKDLPEGLEAPILVALNKDPENRHASAERFAAELRQLLRRGETEIGDALREHIRRDFSGEMPGMLRLEPLNERERAWRSVRSSLPPDPPAPVFEPPQPATINLAALPRPSQPTETASRESSRREEVTSDRATRTSIGTASRAPVSRRRRLDLQTLALVALGVGVVVAGITVGALHLLQPRTPPPSASRFIVVESPDKLAAGSAGAPPAAAAPEAVAAATATNIEPARSVSELPAPPQRKAEPGGAAALSRHFAQREAELQRCFERHAASLSGHPELAVNFEISAAGKVQKATLQPQSLAGTPLEKCLLDVARGTSFGAVGKPLRFTIPIRARSVSRSASR